MFAEAFGSFMATRNFWKNSAETTSVPADRAAGFKTCCMRSGQFDGSERNYYFRK